MSHLRRVNKAIRMLGTHAVTRRRYTGGGYVDGIYQKGTASDTDFKVAIWDIPGSKLKDMPEADHWTDMVNIWIIGDLRGADSVETPDEIIYNSKTYKVIKVHDRKEGAYTKGLLGIKDARNNAVQSS